jgi:glycosyltransferase involved in cell wall biosynthesis
VAKAVRVPAGVPHVCYCFTPMRYAWDGRDAYLDSMRAQPVRRALAASALDRLRDWDRATARGVSHFIAISETVRERIRRCYDRESRVIPPPVDTTFYTPGDRPAERSGEYLCVSALVPYKRIDQAVAACSATGRRLVVIGEGPDRARLQRTAGPSVTFLGWQSDEVIREHYRRCRALIFPGEEDFGIVPAEALACGMPVIALGRGGAAETVDDRVGLLYGDPTVDGLAGALEAWEARRAPADPAEARARAEALAPELFEERVVSFLREQIVGARAGHRLAAPHPAEPQRPIGPGPRGSLRRA